MTEERRGIPVATFPAPRAPDPMRHGLPQPALPHNVVLRPRRRRGPIVLWGTMTAVMMAGFMGGLTPLGTLAAAVGVAGGYAAWLRARARTWNRRLHQGLSSLRSRDLRAAEESLLLCAKTAPSETAHALAALHAGAVAYLRGDVGEALRRYAVAAGCKGLQDGNPTAAALATSSVALCYALQGDLGGAEGWVTRARQAQERYRPLLRHVDVAEAVLRARQGRLTEALDLVVSARPELATSLTAAEMSQVRLLEAFCLAGLGREGADPLVQAQRPFPAEVRGLCSSWQQMRAFLLERAPGEDNLLD